MNIKHFFMAIIGIGIFMVFGRRSKPFSSCSQRRGLVIGDSLTAHGGYVSEIRLSTSHPWDVVAEVGWRTSSMLTAARVTDFSKYSSLVVLGGVNDFVHARVSAQNIIWNLSEILRIAQQAGVEQRIIVSTTPWAGYRTATAEALEKQRIVNAWILSGADGLATAVVDTSSLGAPDGHLVTLYANADRLHLNVAGQRRLGQLISERL